MESSIFNLMLLPIVLLTISGIFAGLSVIILSIVKSKEIGNYSIVKYNLTAILCVVVAALSWFTNFGWLRLFMTFTMIPLIHTVIFFFINSCAVSHINKSNILKVLIVYSYISYSAGYVFLPDGGEVDSYVLFGLIHNDFIVNLSQVISSIGFAVNGVLLLVQLIMIIVMSVQAKKLNKEDK